jgi:tetratricopeptide (TPR) repeat protein
VQRWEREQGLPVHRLLHTTQSSVYAYARDLDDWLAAREPVLEEPNGKSRRVVRATSSRACGQADATAHECSVRARHFMGKRTAPAVVQAIREYRKALDANPTLASAHAGIAEAYVVLTGSEFKASLDGYPKARAAALQALEIEPGLAPAHAALGFVKAFFDADWAGADAEFRASLAADSNSAVANYWRGLMLMNLGKFADAQEAILRAVDLAPLSAAMTANASRPFIVAGDWDTAIAWCQRALDLDSEFWMVHLFMGFAYDGKGDHAQARCAFETSLKLGGSGGVWGSLAHACAKQGDRVAAEAMVREMAGQKGAYVSPVRFARIATALGEIDEAFQWLERACGDLSIRSNCYPQYDYAFEPLRSDARFADVLRSLSLTEPHLVTIPIARRA